MLLKTVPFEIDVPKIAQGMLNLFDDDERVVLRFGMLPAAKMALLKKSLEAKFLEKKRGMDESTVKFIEESDAFNPLNQNELVAITKSQNPLVQGWSSSWNSN